ncbi:MAG: hypothetical protein ACREUK_13000, partial [Burkholderiales bacterium]
PALAGILLAAASAAAAAQERGRLFFTPEQRAELDARRKARVPDKPAAVLIESPSTTLDGYVKRSNGKSTLFLNGEPITEGADAQRAQVIPSRDDPTRAAIEVGEGGRRIPLRVGESLDRGTGEVSDVIGKGEIDINPRKAELRK